ncbi:hypothetical protein [Actinomadura oligospora]|uniref:hypothetical protein n=1 Tax=Actinomadura oligospora TaxID=111804 RepID=UPI0004B446A8|nr:hypothetical protein [Actinomadura oligospora]
MFITPLPVDIFLRHVLSASEDCGYAGVVLLLARTADARSQQEEVTRDWASVHDVTGPMLAVVCPVPYPQDGPRPVRGGGVPHPEGSIAVGVEGLTLNCPQVGTWSSFPTRYWWSLEGERGFRGLGERAARISLSAEEHHAAWTQATTRTASYFGIEESLLPSVLVLSMWERRGVLLAVDERVSVYSLFKKLVENMGPAPRRLEELAREQAEVDDHLPQLAQALWDWEVARRRVPLEWPRQVDALDRHLGEVEYLDASLVGDCRRRLSEIRDTGGSDRELAENLLRVIDLLPPGPEAIKMNIRSGLPKRIRRVVVKLERGHPGIEFLNVSKPPGLDRVAEEVSKLRTRQHQLPDEIAAIKRSVNLSAAAISVGQELLGPVEESPLREPRTLPLWTFTHLQRRGSYSQPVRRVLT